MNKVEGFETTQQREASDEIRDNLMFYSEDVLLTKFPHFADGCKNLTRRIIWFTKDVKDLRPMNKVVGDLQEVHTSGDGSIADAVLRLGQPFTVGHPLVYIEGKYGEYYDVDAAAATRYLEAKSSEFTQDIYFKGVNTAAFQMVPTKNNRNIEPRYLIPKLPMALVLGNLTVGIAFTSRVQMIDIADICKLVMTYAKYYQEGGLSIPPNKLIAKYLIPSFPIKGLILNRKELLENYARGNYECPISMEGWVDISGNSITLRALPYGVNFGKTVGAFRERFKNPKDWIKDYLDSANDYSSEETEFTINLKHGKNPFEVLERLRGNLKIDTTFYPFYNYVRKEKIETLSPPVLTYYWYQERAANIATGLKYRQAQLIEKRMCDQAILLVVDEADDVVKLVRSSESKEDAVKAIYKRFDKLTLKQAGIIADQPISVWTKNTRKKLEEELEQIAADLETVHSNFNRIDETIYNETTVLLRKYKSTSDTYYADDYIGYVKFGDMGIVNFFNYDQMKEILLTKGWPTSLVKTVHLYDPKLPRRFILRNGRLMEQKEMTKEVWCSQMFCYPLSERNELTLVVSDKAACVIEKIVPTVENDKFRLYPITKQFYALHRNGSITTEMYTSLSIRKSICKGSKSDIICGLPNTTEDVALIYMNTSDPNVLRISRILRPGHENKLKFVPTGDVYILGVYPLKTHELIINIPKQCLRNFRLNHILINNLERLFDDGKDNHFFNLSRVKSELGKICKQDKQVSSFYHIDFGGIGQKQDD